MTSKYSQRGSALLWLIAALFFVVLGVVAFLIWGKTFLLTEGLDSSQVNTYIQTIDSANQLKSKVENMNQSNTNSLNKLNQLKNTNLPSY